MTRATTSCRRGDVPAGIATDGRAAAATTAVAFRNVAAARGARRARCPTGRRPGTAAAAADDAVAARAVYRAVAPPPPPRVA